MKSILKILLIALVIPSSIVFSQSKQSTTDCSSAIDTKTDRIMTGYSVSSAGKIIYKTTDGGKNWLNQIVPAKDQIKPINFGKKSSGSIREITNEGLTGGKPVTVNESDGFMPVHDFKNSVNGSATIKFTLQYPGFVSIKIYDIAGNTIDELARSNFGSGDHEVKWNAGKFTGSEYFYSLVTSEFSETKKMNLTK